MIEIDEKHRRTKAVILSNFKRPLPPLKASTQGATRQPAPKVDTAASECDGGKGAPEAVPQNVTGADNEPPDSTGAISPGKFDPRDGDASLVANYVSEIGGNWQRGVDAFMNIARLCAQASEQLTVAQRSELMPELPFGEATFSKFVQIGTDTRLNAPEVQRLLPPHYTTTYAVTLLTDEELKEAIAEKVIHPDMQREELQRWRKSHRERVRVAPSPQATTNDSAVASLPIAPTRDGVGSGLFRSAARDPGQPRRSGWARGRPRRG
jgi:hypothetical protein